MTQPPPTDAQADSFGVFAAHVAHDFNNLLTGILGNLELMQNRMRRNGHEEYAAYLDGARSAGGRAAGFAQRLLALSGRNTGDAVPINLADIAANIVASKRAEGREIGLDMPALTILCDPNDAELALYELLDNAIEATPAGGVIMFSGRDEPGYIKLAVQDHGAGMGPELLAKACQPFFTTRANGTGHGLGLAIAVRFAQSLGGTLSLESAPGQGTTATISLPKAEL